MTVKIHKILSVLFVVPFISFGTLTSFGDDRLLSPPVPEKSLQHQNSICDAQAEPAVEDTVVAALVKSWGYWNYLVWEDLGQNWSQYGQSPILIDTTLLNRESFSYSDLVSTGADMLIVSDPCGSWKSFAEQEILAMEQYAQGGHNLLGTYLLLSYTYGDTAIDNRGLAPVFGLDSSLAYSMRAIDRRYHFGQGEYIFEGMESPYRSQGYNLSQVPEKGLWTAGDLVDARIAAATSDSLGVVTFYPAGKYVAVFVSSMPEYGGGEADKRFLYNVITYQGPTAVEESDNSLLVKEHFLLKNYPNPFNNTTTISYRLTEPGHVSLTVFDLRGRLVITLFEGSQAGGEHKTTWKASEVSSGVYFYKLSAGDHTATKKMNLVK